jgi:hypothetical protein
MLDIPSQPPQVTSEPRPDLSQLEENILITVVYADIFDYPLTSHEIHRYCPAVSTTDEQVTTALMHGGLVPDYLEQHGEFYSLSGRGALVSTRQRRERVAARMWPRARRYARWLMRLPFVRMVALTGALAANNPRDNNDDFDYLIVTAAGRLWTCRAFTILLVRLARLLGDELCPNYLLAEESLRLEEQNLFAAHEFVRMIPFAGIEVYRRMQAENGWIHSYLPNAEPPALTAGIEESGNYPLKALLEKLLSGVAGSRLENWEMRRKIARFRSAARGSPEAVFSATCCKGHFDRHGERTLSALEERLGETH